VETALGAGSAFHFTARLGLDPANASSSEAGGPPGPEALPAVKASAAGPRRRRLRVLVADDNRINRHLVVSILEKHGHSVVLAVNGLEAVAAARKGGLDAALLDVQMPEMDGLQATAAIRAAEVGTGRHLPIVALTAHALKGDREACLAAGMDHYLAKPIHAAGLLSALDGLVGEPAFDPREALARVEGDATLLAELVEILRAESPRLLADLRRRLEAADARGVQDAAHALKGSVANFGGHAAAAAAGVLERMGREAALDGGFARLAELEQEVDRLLSSLDRMGATASSSTA
jgi:CheY-like chemotaxis protein